MIKIDRNLTQSSLALDLTEFSRDQLKIIHSHTLGLPAVIDSSLNALPSISIVEAGQLSPTPDLVFKNRRCINLPGYYIGQVLLERELISKKANFGNVTLNSDPNIKISGNVLNLNKYYANEFFHFVFEVLYAVYLARTLLKPELAPNAVVLPSLPNPKFRKILDRLLPEEWDRFNAPSANELLECDHLISIPRSTFACDEFSTWIMESKKTKNITPMVSPCGRKIFCVRDQATNNLSARVLRNQDSLIEIAENHGLDVIDFGAIDFFDQIELAQSANMMIGVHGGALTHSLFMRPNSVLCELFGPTYVNNCFYQISVARRLRYHFFTSEGLDIDQCLRGLARDSSVVIDSSIFKAQLARLLELT